MPDGTFNMIQVINSFVLYDRQSLGKRGVLSTNKSPTGLDKSVTFELGHSYFFATFAHKRKNMTSKAFDTSFLF